MHVQHEDAEHGADRDVRLVKRAQRGDADAVRLLWQRHAGWLAAVIMAHKPSNVEVDDLMQEVAVAMVRHIDTIREPAMVRGWLRQIALNAARAAGRRAQRGAAMATRNGMYKAAPTSDEAERREASRRMVALTEQLPVAYREPLLLRAVHGLSASQIAQMLDLTEATVHTRISRARQMLRGLAARDDALSDLVPTAEAGQHRIDGRDGTG